ncbi:Malonyl-[acyl-carrier protein] O-methyltransferase [Madurella mycetomatis]|uniref:Malonyl-[acyl-carrier protein] O-methyltransferase n=1 Tax=Madurella mycetomatis TaxID=100816 RepID=A0A175W556_9PEZI|nr:Malonyl-[acyl-carrier protein] O-methyltransferase [Madurella mycetomatis]
MEEHVIIEALTDEDSEPNREPSRDPSRDVTSDYEPSELESKFGSLTSSVNDHVWEYGRRYHAFRYGRYPIPNDEEEYKRESLRHLMLKDLLNGKLYLAPIGDNPQKIIDLGTGFGDWAIEVGEAFPSATITGVDLSPIQPHWVPPNVEFIVDDIEDEWVHDKDYDFVHLRFVNTVIKNNAALFDKILQNLKPGGWVEIQDIYPKASSDDGTVPPDYPLNKFYSTLGGILQERYGFDFWVVHQLPELLQRLGYVNVQKKVFHMPVGAWARDKHLRLLGGYFREILRDFIGAMAARPFVEAGFEKDEIAEQVSNTMSTISNRRFHAYVPIHFVWAQKPPE